MEYSLLSFSDSFFVSGVGLYAIGTEDAAEVALFVGLISASPFMVKRSRAAKEISRGLMESYAKEYNGELIEEPPESESFTLPH